jgi:hypothetical protein
MSPPARRVRTGADSLAPAWRAAELRVGTSIAGDITGQVPMARFASPVDGGWTADAGWISLRLRKR